MSYKISAQCIHCGELNETSKEWVEENTLVFCETCCKCFEPANGRVYRMPDSDTLSQDVYSSEDSDDGWASGDGWHSDDSEDE